MWCANELRRYAERWDKSVMGMHTWPNLGSEWGDRDLQQEDGEGCRCWSVRNERWGEEPLWVSATKDWDEAWDVGEVGSWPTWNGGSGASWNLLCKILLWSGLTIKYHKELLVDSLKGNWKSYLQETTTILSKRELCNTWSFATFPWSLKGITEHKGSYKGNVHHNHHKGNYNCFSSLCSCSWYSFSWYVILPHLSLTLPQWRSTIAPLSSISTSITLPRNARWTTMSKSSKRCSWGVSPIGKFLHALEVQSDGASFTT